MTLFHLAEARSWAQAQSWGAYTQSTLGRSLKEEGFIHASSAQQWPVVRRAFYSGVDEPLVLLCCCAPPYTHADTVLMDGL